MLVSTTVRERPEESESVSYTHLYGADFESWKTLETSRIRLAIPRFSWVNPFPATAEPTVCFYDDAPGKRSPRSAES